MIAAERCGADCVCSPNRQSAQSVGWVHSTGVNGIERSSTDVTYSTLTCRNGVLAGQRPCPGKFDTEAVAQRASTVLNGVKVQVNGVVEDVHLSLWRGERFSVSEVRVAPHDRVGQSDSFLRLDGTSNRVTRSAHFGALTASELWKYPPEGL